MRPLILSKKTGFKIKNLEPVIIRDKRGLIFYSTEGIENVKKFNLPSGEYFIDKGNFELLPEPVKYKLNKLPDFERKKSIPFDFEVLFGTNRNKCSILWEHGKILFDKECEDFTLPELYFILFHEYGHAKYKTEKYCDLFAANLMLRKGFNPSQIGLGSINSLSEKQDLRKNYIVDSIANNKQK